MSSFFIADYRIFHEEYDGKLQYVIHIQARHKSGLDFEIRAPVASDAEITEVFNLFVRELEQGVIGNENPTD